MSGLNSGSRSVSRSRGNRLNTAANAMGASGRAQAEVDAVTKRGVTVIRAGDVQPVGFREVRRVAIERELHQPVHPRLAVPQGRELEAARARGGQLAQSFGLQRIEVDGLIFAMPFEPAEPDERKRGTFGGGPQSQAASSRRSVPFSMYISSLLAPAGVGFELSNAAR